jgi:hypothetical protein
MTLLFDPQLFPEMRDEILSWCSPASLGRLAQTNKQGAAMARPFLDRFIARTQVSVRSRLQLQHHPALPNVQQARCLFWLAQRLVRGNVVNVTFLPNQGFRVLMAMVVMYTSMQNKRVLVVCPTPDESKHFFTTMVTLRPHLRPVEMVCRSFTGFLRYLWTVKDLQGDQVMDQEVELMDQEAFDHLVASGTTTTTGERKSYDLIIHFSRSAAFFAIGRELWWPYTRQVAILSALEVKSRVAHEELEKALGKKFYLFQNQ